MRVRRVVGKPGEDPRAVVLRAATERRKKPTREQRENGGRLEMKEEVAPLHTRPMDPIPPKSEGAVTVWNPERIAHFLAYIASGGLVIDWCKKAGVDRGVVTALAKRDQAFADAYEVAKQERIEVLAEEALQIASTPSKVQEEIVTTHPDGSSTKAVKTFDNTYARKLAFGARMDLLAKWAPDRYGPGVKPDSVSSQAAAILKARRRLKK